MPNKTILCNIDKCFKKHHARGLCLNHYNFHKKRNSLPKAKTLESSFWQNVSKTNNCWNWIGMIESHGYGSIEFRGNRFYAHRLSLMIHNQKLIKNLSVDHLCRNRACVNPSHLEQVSTKENLRRGSGIVGLNYRKTHCVNGHPFNEKNTYIYKNKKSGVIGRICKLCQKERTIFYRQRDLFLHPKVD